jgi:hypothetical protein
MFFFQTHISLYALNIYHKSEPNSFFFKTKMNLHYLHGLNI